MKKNGFTLIELIGVIVLISAIALILVPAVSTSLKKGADRADKIAKENIEMAAKNWSLDNKDKLKTTCYVSVQTLKTDGYLDNDDIKLPSDSTKNLNGSVVVITVENKDNKTVYKYEYKDASSDNECKKDV